MVSYLTDRYQYVQLDDQQSTLVETHFGVRQGSVLDPFIFNLCVSDPSIPHTCYQYADDTTVLDSGKVKDLDGTILEMERTLQSLNTWSNDSNLALNPKKTKSLLISTAQMSRIHSLCNKEIHLNLEANVIERVESAKLLGVHFTELLDWSEHVRNLLSSCYATLSTLRKIKNVTLYNICKQLVEMLVISKMDYCDIVYDLVPDYQLKRLQHVQNTCT